MRICAMAETWILYQTTNVCNGKIYVGVHKLANTKRSRNYLGSGYALKPAIEKYGIENFTRLTLAEFNCPENAYDAEAKVVTADFILREDTYNIRLGGKGCWGLKHSEETKKKMSFAKKGTVVNPETRMKLSTALKGKPKTEETKRKMSASQKGKKISEEHRASIKISHNTPEAKANMSAAQKGKKLSAEHKLKISIAKSGSNNHNFGKPCPDEVKAKISAACSVPIIVCGEYYKSIDNASKTKEVTYKTVFYRVKSDNPKWSEWRLATDAEKLSHLSEL